MSLRRLFKDEAVIMGWVGPEGEEKGPYIIKLTSEELKKLPG